jgi:hypothetical protein
MRRTATSRKSEETRAEPRLAKREPTGPTQSVEARIKLESLTSPLRARARPFDDGRLVVEAELPWLRLGAPIETELPSGKPHVGVVSWIGIDMTKEGGARLRILIGAPDGKAKPASRPPSVELSVHDSDVMLDAPAIPPPPPRPRRRRTGLIAVLAVSACSAGWFAGWLLTRPAARSVLEAVPAMASPAKATAPATASGGPEKASAPAKATATAPSATATAPSATATAPSATETTATAPALPPPLPETAAAPAEFGPAAPPARTASLKSAPPPPHKPAPRHPQRRPGSR